MRVGSSSVRRGAVTGSIEYATVPMSRSVTPSDFTRSMTALERRATSAVASATVGARISAPSRTTAVSGFTATRPVPRTEINRGVRLSGLAA